MAKLNKVLWDDNPIDVTQEANFIWLIQYNLMAINYAEWLAFANSMFRFAKYSIISKPVLRVKYLSGKLDDEFQILYSDIEKSFNDTFKNYQIKF